MKTSRKWIWLLAGAFACLAPAPAFCEDIFGGAVASQPLGEQVTTGTNWDAPAPPDPESLPSAAPINGVGGACESCCMPGFQWIMSVEGTFFWPQFNRAFLSNTLVNELGTAEILSTTQNGSVEGSLMTAPRTTFGLQGERWGLFGRYWYASTWASSFAPSIPGAASYGNIGFDGLRAYTADLEVRRRFCMLNWDMYGFAGVRYASVNNDRTLFSSNSFDGPELSALAFAGQQFNGTGVSYGFSGMRPIWCDDSPFKLFFANRYSFIWGHGNVAVQTRADYIDGTDALTSTNGAAATGNGDLFIAELQLGLHWDACLKCIPGRVFVRTALEYQYWDINTGAQADSTSFVTINNDPVVTSTASARNMLIDLIGFNVGVGFMY